MVLELLEEDSKLVGCTENQALEINAPAVKKESRTLIRYSEERKGIYLHCGKPNSLLTRILELLCWPLLKLVHFDKFQKISNRYATDPRTDEFIYNKLLDSLDVKTSYNQDKVAQIPREGPLLVVGNHPLALVDGFAIATVIRAIRPDMKGLTISGLKAVPNLKQHIIRVKLDNSEKSKKRNYQATMESIKWLKDGHALIMFPSGEFSVRKHLLDKTTIEDHEWAKGLGLLIRRCKPNVLPVFFYGQTSFLFQCISKIHKSLGKLFFLREILLARNTTVKFVIGDTIPSEALAKMDKSQDVVDYLRKVVYSLEKGNVEKS